MRSTRSNTRQQIPGCLQVCTLVNNLGSLIANSTLCHRDCFVKFIAAKCAKQVSILGKETRTGPGITRRYLLGLSRGVSSTVLLHLLNENINFQLSRNRSPPFELTAVYVDPSCLYHPQSLPLPDSSSSSSSTLDRYRRRYPRFEYRCIPLTAVLNLTTIDWSALPLSTDTSQPPEARLRSLFDGLPSAASRTDILRLFTRHILLSASHSAGCQALLLGHSTTAIAELTLAEAAKGRGFSLPWQIHDGQQTLSAANPNLEEVGGRAEMLVYHPLRDVLRKELVTYATLTSPPLADLVDSDGTGSVREAVVSHKDLSIEEVMIRYFAEVEENYPSVVANVARTTGKLVRLSGEEERGERSCGMCGMPLDDQGDERWRGELGIGEGGDGGDNRGGGSAIKGKLCYGCERSIRG